MAKTLDAHVLAAFYNDARINILLCLNDIREKANRKPLENEDQIVSALDGLNLARQRVEEESKTEKRLRFRFPFLNVLTDLKKTPIAADKYDEDASTPRDIEAQLRSLLTLINDLRNATVHPTSQHHNIDKDRYKNYHDMLARIYDAATSIIKQRFGHDDTTMSALLRCDNKGKPKRPDKHALALYPSRFYNGKNLPKSVKPREVFSDFGHVLFCALFLERQGIAELMRAFSETTHHYDASIALEIVSVYRIRMPIQRLQSADTQTALTLDALSELSRCPRPLLDTLSPDDKARFRYQPDEETELESDIQEPKGTYLFARSHQDRFRTLIMRFFDFDSDDHGLRFAIDLGDYHYNVRLKPGERFVDGRQRVRRLGKKLIGYGRLNEFIEAEKPQPWKMLEKNWDKYREQEEYYLQTTATEIRMLDPYIVPTQPHYHYYDDKIGCQLATNDTSAHYPDLKSALDSSGQRLNRDFRRSLEPEFWISPAQLLHLAFYHYLCKKAETNVRPQSIDVVMKRYRAGMVKLIQALQHGVPSLDGEPNSDKRKKAAQCWVNSHFNNENSKMFVVSLNTLPKVVVYHLLGKVRSGPQKKVLDRLTQMINRTEQRIRSLENGLKIHKKRGKRGFKPIKCGVVADFVSEDLMRFQPIDTSRSDGGKINSQQYQILQAALAYYNVHLEEPPKIMALFKAAGLIRGERPHPFLHKLGLEQQTKKYPGILSFYSAYLKERKRFLEHYKKAWQKGRGDDIPHWLRLRQSASLENWLDEQFDHNGKLMPLPLADNMLYPPILSMLADILHTTPAELEKEGSKTFSNGGVSPPSITWLTRRYLQSQEDEPQEMYHYKRRYDLFDVMLDNRKAILKGGKLDYGFKARRPHFLTEPERKTNLRNIRKKARKQGGSPLERAKREKLASKLPACVRTESKIRYHIPQDILLWLYTQERLAEDLSLSSEQTPSQWKLKNIAHTLLDTTIEHCIEVPGTGRLIHHVCKVRNLGEIYRLVRDRRLTTLLNYYPDAGKPLGYGEMRAELADYQRRRIQIMKLIHQLERAVQQKAKTSKSNEYCTIFGRGEHGKLLSHCYDLFGSRGG